MKAPSAILLAVRLCGGFGTLPNVVVERINGKGDPHDAAHDQQHYSEPVNHKPHCEAHSQLPDWLGVMRGESRADHCTAQCGIACMVNTRWPKIVPPLTQDGRFNVSRYLGGLNSKRPK